MNAVNRLSIYVIESEHGLRIWQAEDIEHAIEQHNDAFPDESVLGISIAIKAQWGDGALPAAQAND